MTQQPTPEIYATTADGLRFYEETALKYVHDGKRRLVEAVLAAIVLAAAIAAALVYLTDDALWAALLMLLPLGWGVSGTGQWLDGRQYFVKIEAQRHYRARDLVEAQRVSSVRSDAPSQTLRAPVSDDDDDGKIS